MTSDLLSEEEARTRLRELGHRNVFRLMDLLQEADSTGGRGTAESKCDPQILEILAYHPQAAVRRVAASVLVSKPGDLVFDTEPNVRWSVALYSQNPDALLVLTGDEAPHVAASALSNPSTPLAGISPSAVSHLKASTVGPDACKTLLGHWEADAEAAAALHANWEGTLGELAEATGLVSR